MSLRVPSNPLRRTVRIAGFASITSSMATAFALREVTTPAEKHDTLRDRWVGRWADALLRLFDIEIVYDGEIPAKPQGRGRLVIANHRSSIDIGIALRTFGGFVVSRADLAKWPLIGAAARRVGTVFVDRSDVISGASAIRQVRDLLKGGSTVTLFAEGGTFEGDEVRPFQGGAFVAVLHTDAEILPVGIAYESGSGAAFVNESFLQHLGRMIGAPKSRVVVAIGEPILVREGIRAADLKAQTHAAVEELVARARARVDGRS